MSEGLSRSGTGPGPESGRTDDELRLDRVLDRVIEYLPSAVLIETAERRVVAANRRFRRLFLPEAAPESLPGSDGRAVVAAARDRFADSEATLRRLEEVARLREPVTGEPVRLADGRVVSFDYLPIADEEPGAPAHLWIFLDGPPLDPEGAAAPAEDESFRQVFDGCTDEMLLLDRDGRIVDANRRACEALGYAREELLAMSIRDVDPALDAKLFEEAWSGMSAAEPAPLSGSHRRKDGSTFPVEVRVRSFRLDDHEVMLAVARDTSERERLEAQLAQGHKMEAIGRLAGGIAHDFNNALTAILGHVSLLEPELRERPDLGEDLGEIQRAAERAASLTRHLLAFGRRQVLQSRRIDPADVLRGADGLLRRLLGDDVALEVHVPATPSEVWVDPEKLEHALLNLAVNAREAMPDGGRMSLALKYADVGELEAWRLPFPFEPGRYAVLSVTDTGPGIPDAMRAKIFEPFFSTKPREKGAGLGLSMVYGFVKQSGGYVWVESRENEGSTFYVALPLVAGGPSEPGGEPLAPPSDALLQGISRPESRGPDASRPEAWERGEGSVLIAEDEPSVLAVVQRALGERGYDVLPARDGIEALEVLDRHAGPVDLLVTDAIMPRMGGVDLAMRLRERIPGVPVLITSGYSADLARKVQEIGGRVRLLEKPFTASDIARVVGELLRH